MQEYREGQRLQGSDGRTYVVRNGVPVPESAGRIIPTPVDPTAPYEAPQARANVERTQTQTEIDRAKAPAEIRQAQAGATQAEAEAEQTVRETQRVASAEQQKATRQAFRTESILQAIREARNIVRSRGGVGWSSLLSGLPETDAKALKTAVDPIKGNLSFGRLQEMRDESKTGGAVGNVSNVELELLASTVASLDQGVDAATFLDRLDKIERYFIDAQLSNDGYERDDPARRQLMRDQFGYTGVFEDELSAARPELGGANASQTEVQIPEEYQREHLRYLRDNWGRIDANDYVRFRAGLDQAFDLNPDLSAYAKAAGDLNAAAAEGVPPEGAGSVPNPVRDLSMGEQAINYAAQSAPGAAFASATNAFAGGLPARLGGQQDNLELLREVRPVSSFVGELAGGAAGTLALGAGAGAMGGRVASMLGNPFGAEIAHSATYGATQDDNALRGAGMGLGGAIGGAALGRVIGREFPEVFAGRAVADADNSVPSIDDLKDLASQQYRDVEAAGVRAMPNDTQDLYQRAQAILSGEAKVTPKGRMTQIDGKTAEAMRLLKDYAGEMMTPTQAQSVRRSLAEGMSSADRGEQRIAGMLTRDFDEWADPVLPGISTPRATAQRYLQGEQLQQRAGIADIRGQRMKGNDTGDSYRTQFGQMDEAIAKGQAYFDPPTTEAIARAARGDRFTNAMRALGKYGLGNPLTAGGIGAGGMAAAANIVDPTYTAMALGAGLFGSGARRIASQRTTRAAQEAELMALGGEEYRAALQAAIDKAAANSGRIFGGAGGVLASNATR